MTTYITGYWNIKDNIKNSYENHYKKLIPKTLDILNNCNIIFFYDNEEILKYVKRNIKTKNIIYIKINIESLETYNISNDYLKSCKLQDNNYLKKINIKNEKGLIHYEREYKKSGENSFKKVFTIWTSKIFLVNKIIDKNPFNTNFFAWIDISASRININNNYYKKNYLSDYIYHFNKNIMKYYGEKIEINGFFLLSNINTWKKLIFLYKNQLELCKNSNYSHDEETLLHLIMKENKNLFYNIELYMKTNFESAKKFVDMKIKDNQESISGQGSYIENTKETVYLINEIIKNYNIKSILDLGCGDWNWFKNINLRKDITYIGWDAHDKMIENNNKYYGNKNINFIVKDIILEDYPKVDLIICRDVLFHLDILFSKKCIEKIKKSCKYLISTSFNDILKNNNIKSYCNIDNWGFYEINLNIKPFYLKNNLIKCYEEKKNISNKKNKRYINFYKFI
jgi:SAM-dependent methyltransferase